MVQDSDTLTTNRKCHVPLTSASTCDHESLLKVILAHSNLSVAIIQLEMCCISHLLNTLLPHGNCFCMTWILLQHGWCHESWLFIGY